MCKMAVKTVCLYVCVYTFIVAVVVVDIAVHQSTSHPEVFLGLSTFSLLSYLMFLCYVICSLVNELVS